VTSSWVAVAACTATFCGAPVGTVSEEGDRVTALLPPEWGKAPLDTGGPSLSRGVGAGGTGAAEPPPHGTQPRAAPRKVVPCQWTHPLRPRRPPGGGWGDPRPRRCTRSCGSRSADACSGLRGEKGSAGPPLRLVWGSRSPPGEPAEPPSLGKSGMSPGSNRSGQAEVSPWTQFTSTAQGVWFTSTAHGTWFTSTGHAVLPWHGACSSPARDMWFTHGTGDIVHSMAQGTQFTSTRHAVLPWHGACGSLAWGTWFISTGHVVHRHGTRHAVHRHRTRSSLAQGTWFTSTWFTPRHRARSPAQGMWFTPQHGHAEGRDTRGGGRGEDARGEGQGERGLTVQLVLGEGDLAEVVHGVDGWAARGRESRRPVSPAGGTGGLPPLSAHPSTAARPRVGQGSPARPCHPREPTGLAQHRGAFASSSPIPCAARAGSGHQGLHGGSDRGGEQCMGQGPHLGSALVTRVPAALKMDATLFPSGSEDGSTAGHTQHSVTQTPALGTRGLSTATLSQQHRRQACLGPRTWWHEGSRDSSTGHSPTPTAPGWHPGEAVEPRMLPSPIPPPATHGSPPQPRVPGLGRATSTHG